MVEGIDLVLDGPGLIQLRGSNGAGKSTLIEVVSGYLPLQGGEAHVGGVPVGDPRARAMRRICRTRPALFPELAAGDHLAFGARVAGSDLAEALARSERYGLGPWLDTAAKALSTGNQRKLWLIMCTLGEVPLYVLDEPFHGLDAHGRDVLVDEVTAWSARSCVVLVTHEPPAGLRPARTVELVAPARSPHLSQEAA